MPRRRHDMPVKYVELDLLHASPGRAVFRKLFQEAEGRARPKVQQVVRMDDEQWKIRSEFRKVRANDRND